MTYADVWEFWLRNPALLEAVDFVTIHILPYWEDFPIPANEAGAHLEAIRQQSRGGFSRQGDPDRRNRLAERGANAGRRLALAGEPGPGSA